MWPALVGGGAALGGAAMSYFGARSANKMNQQMAREQMQFQERMSNTSWQRAVTDMEQAGINPMVAFSQGGASSPSGAMSTSMNELGQGLTSGVEAARASAEIQNMREQNRQIRSQTNLNHQLAKVAEKEAVLKLHSGKSAEFKYQSDVTSKMLRQILLGPGGEAILDDIVNLFKAAK